MPGLFAGFGAEGWSNRASLSKTNSLPKFASCAHFLSRPQADTLAQSVIIFRDAKGSQKRAMTRTDAIANAHHLIASGEFLTILDRRVGYKTESQNAGRAEELRAEFVVAVIGHDFAPGCP